MRAAEYRNQRVRRGAVAKTCSNTNHPDAVRPAVQELNKNRELPVSHASGVIPPAEPERVPKKKCRHTFT
jgi:hypothetical protein